MMVLCRSRPAARTVDCKLTSCSEKLPHRAKELGIGGLAYFFFGAVFFLVAFFFGAVFFLAAAFLGAAFLVACGGGASHQHSVGATG